jgi:ankyrin repeat protein
MEALTAMLACAEESAPQKGWTPLHNASLKGHFAVLGALLAKGADVQAKTDVSIARAGALYHRAHSHACKMRMAMCLYGGCARVFTPLAVAVSQDVEAKTNVSIARACALCPSRLHMRMLATI